MEPPDINIHFFTKRAQFDELRGYKTLDWLCGRSKDDDIYTFTEDTFAIETSHPQVNFMKILKHEICHNFIMVGERFFVGEAKPDNGYSKQY